MAKRQQTSTSFSDLSPGPYSFTVTAHFSELAKLQRATAAEIAVVPGIDEDLAHAIKDTLNRLTETSILDQYH